MRLSSIVLRLRSIGTQPFSYFCQKFGEPAHAALQQKTKVQHLVMIISFILSVALAAVVLVIMASLIAILIYYRWRNTELLTGLRRFFRENLRQREELERMRIELERLNTNIKKKNN